ncbi:hypothetical protein D3C80_394610 [compost metagenome]
MSGLKIAENRLLLIYNVDLIVANYNIRDVDFYDPFFIYLYYHIFVITSIVLSLLLNFNLPQ